MSRSHPIYTHSLSNVAYLCQIAWDTTIKVYRRQHIAVSRTAIDIVAHDTGEKQENSATTMIDNEKGSKPTNEGMRQQKGTK